jgi:hypothetical protein
MHGDSFTSDSLSGTLVMPVHDWTRVFDGAFHAFHLGWIAELQNELNGGILPKDYYAIAEHVAGPAFRDVRTLQTTDRDAKAWSGEPIAGATAVAVTPPRVRERAIIEEEVFTRRQRSILLRRSSNDRIVAMIEIVSSANKASDREFRAFVAKAVDALERGYHLLLVDLQSPTPRDPEGIHTAIWAELGGKPKPPPSDKPLTLVAYDAGLPKTAYVERVAVGDVLIDMPLFLAPGWYINVPLEATYMTAWRGVPRRFREILQPAVLNH